MNRLTEKYINCDKHRFQRSHCGADDIIETLSIEDRDLFNDIEDGIEQLAAYEDTGLEPEEVQRLKEELKTAKSNADAMGDMYKAAERSNSWISVKDGLPEEFVSVLIHIPGECPLPTVCEGFLSPDKKWTSLHAYFAMHEVTHWRPLPDPPEEEQS